VEILVAVVILEVGLLGVVGTLWLASRTVTRAELLERGVEVMEGVYDSLVGEPTPSDGTRPADPGQVDWYVNGRDLRLEYRGVGGDTLARVDARLPGVGLRP
jgi:Tfp pilus assembly protein PilV